MQANNYHLLVTDNNMPKVTGVELIKQVHAAHMALPVIMVSGVMPTDELARHPGLKIDAALLKPFTMDEFIGTVRTVLRPSPDSHEQIARSPASRNQPAPNGWRM